VRVAFLGNAPWSVPPLEALAESAHRPALVLTREPRPERRGSGVVPTPVADAARRLGLSLAEVRTVKEGEGFELLAAERPDVLAVVAYGEILPVAVLEIPRVAPVNLHFSLLPELRGAAPVQRAILDGLVSTGVTTMVMDRGMDTGAILEQATEEIGAEDDAGSLGARLAAIGGRLLVDTLDRLEDGVLQAVPQDEARATSAPRLTAGDRISDWAVEAGGVARRVRAFAPEPGAQTAFRGQPLKVLAVRAEPGAGPPGVVLEAPRTGAPLVAAGEGAIRLVEVAPAGRRRMAGAEFARGSRLEAGERLGG
jgi:methionyl-tRNA formyltransferase